MRLLPGSYLEYEKARSERVGERTWGDVEDDDSAYMDDLYRESLLSQGPPPQALSENAGRSREQGGKR